MSDNYLLRLYERILKLPAGRRLFSMAFARKAPYFSSVRPLVVELRENYCEVAVPKRKAVENHIGTVHVIAICNGLEMAMGGLAEASVPKHLRWIPKGMDVEYTAKADSDITCIAELEESAWLRGPDVPVKVTAKREDGTVVVKGHIHLWVTEKSS